MRDNRLKRFIRNNNYLILLGVMYIAFLFIWIEFANHN